MEVNILAADSDISGILNIGKRENVSVNRVAELIIGLMGTDSIELIHEEPRAGDLRHSLADISRARQIGYNPEYSLAGGLKETAASLIP